MIRVLFISFAMLLAGLSASTVADDQSISAGIDYRAVETPERLEPVVPGENGVEVLEFFWYGCPHCYHLEPELKAWLARQGDAVHFHRVPAASSSRWAVHARAFYAADQLGQLDRLHDPLFRAIQEERRQLFTEDSLVAFAAEQGIDQEAFRQAYASFPVDMQVRKSADLARRYGISGVPALVVDGAFVTSPSQTGSRARAFAVLDALIAQQTGGENADGASAPEAESDTTQ